MKKHVDQNKIREFYNNTPEIWASNDYWHAWSREQISQYLKKANFKKSDYILNAGSAGNTYDIICKMLHIDIAEQKLENVHNSLVASVEKIPIENCEFDAVICVGSVINYCDASAAISELSRVMKHNGTLVLEFESSFGYEYIGNSAYGKSADVVTVKFQGQDHTQWLYSLPYIKSLLISNNVIIDDIYPYQITSALALRLCGNETKAVKYAKLDCIARKIPFLSKHANNYLIRCHKL